MAEHQSLAGLRMTLVGQHGKPRPPSQRAKPLSDMDRAVLRMPMGMAPAMTLAACGITSVCRACWIDSDGIGLEVKT